MKSTAIFLTLGATLLACGASSTRVNGPDGRGTWYSITCRRNQANCVEEAGEVCTRGYDVADSGGHLQLVVTNLYAGEAYSGRMLVKCRDGLRPAAPSAEIPVERENPYAN